MNLPPPPTFDETENAGFDGTGRTDVLISEARAEIADLKRAIDIIGSDLLVEAQTRDWCSEYNEFVDNVNSRLPDGVPKLQPMVRTFGVRLMVEVPNEAALSGLERHIDAWLNDRDFGSCTDFEIEDIS